MNRVKDYSGFAIGFVGLGYIVLWPLSSPGAGGELFGAALICGDTTFALLHLVCQLPHPLQLSPQLHVLGFVSAMVVMARFSLYGLRRTRRARRKPAAGAIDAPVLAARLPAKVTRSRRPAAPLRPVKPRTHFGLRGVRH